ncbi:hypothetical protein N008_19165 [Hymenobacter sp. APR13]|nr:hypothetical protein N008_19165 [Hymenobacter sp. APR13]
MLIIARLGGADEGHQMLPKLAGIGRGSRWKYLSGNLQW